MCVCVCVFGWGGVGGAKEDNEINLPCVFKECQPLVLLILPCSTLDAALVSPGEPTAFPSVRDKPDMTKGMSFNLANNLWDTNYVLWQPYAPESANMKFRFILEMHDDSKAAVAQA